MCINEQFLFNISYEIMGCAGDFGSRAAAGISELTLQEPGFIKELCVHIPY